MDLNILISTIVTATAALVAIIGGFLVSRVITMVSERKGIERRVRELENDLSAKRKMYEKAEQVLLDEDAEDFVRDNLEELISKERNIDEIIQNDTYNYRSIEELQPYLEEIDHIIGEVKEMISGYYREDVANDFESFIRSEAIEVDYKQKMELYEKVYYLLKDSLPKKPVNPLMSDFSSPFDPIAIRANLIPTVVPVSHQAYRDKEKNRDTLKDEVTILTLQLGEQQKILDDYAKPRGFWGGIIVLIYASLVGVAYPTTLLPYPSNYYDDVATKWLLISLFLSQLVALFIYLTYEIHEMTSFSRND